MHKKPGPPPLPLDLTPELREELAAVARCTMRPSSEVRRARIALLAADGQGTEFIAQQVGCEARTVRNCKARFRQTPTLQALRDRPRSGRPAQVALTTRLAVVQAACQRPDEKYVPFRNLWTQASLALAVQVLTGVLLSVSEIGRILRFNHLRPHLVRYWLNTKDPEFSAKAERICEVYLNPPPNTKVFCIDEMPVQALGRKSPSTVGPNAIVREEYEYIRRGTCCALAAFEVGTGQVMVQVVKRRTAEVTVAYMDKLARENPTGDIIVVWDNLNTHKEGPNKRWTAFNARHGNRFTFVFTPIHASWLNQVECFFSIVNRRVIQHADFRSVEHAKERLLGFFDFWNKFEAHPFRWTWRHQPRNEGALKAA